jgi:hypothetical protein
MFSLQKANSASQATFGIEVVVLAVRLNAECRLSARKGEGMKSNLMKRVFAAAFSFALLIGAGSFLTTTAQAQDRGRDRNWQRDRDDRRDNDRDRDWNRDSNWRRQQIERQRQIERERELARQREWARNRSYRSYPYGYGGYGGYGNYGGGYGGQSNYEVQRGYRDGLDRGQEDARDRRSPNPNNSSHFRSGNSAYRSGFVRGYQEGYRQYGGYRRW